MYYKSRKEDENRFLMEKKGDWFPPPYQCKKMLVCKCIWETFEEAEHRGQANNRCVAQGQSRHILESVHSQHERYSRVHTGNYKESKGGGKVSPINRNQLLACQGQGWHDCGYRNDGELFVQEKKRNRTLTV